MTSAADMFRMRRNTTARSTARTQPVRTEEPPAPAASEVISPSEAAPIDDGTAPLRVLVVCTANISRSPLGEAIFARHLSAAGHRAVVRSAGTISTRLEVDPHSVTVGNEMGLDLLDHRPRQLTPEIIAEDGADLIVVMEREHAREVCLIDGDAWTRTYTVKELARMAETTTHRATDARDWLATLGAGRTILDLLGEDSTDDIADTYGTSAATHRRTAELLDDLLCRIARRVPGR